MQSVFGGALRTVLSPIARPACRTVGGIRYPLARRGFHRSAVAYRIPGEQDGGDRGKDTVAPEISKRLDEGEVVGDAAPASTAVPNADTDGSAAARTAGRQTKSAGGRVKFNRVRQPEGLPPVVLPDWFWDKNVKLASEPTRGGSLTVYGPRSRAGEDVVAAVLGTDDIDLGFSMMPTAEEAKYEMHVNVYHEILSTFKAGLVLRPPKTEKNIERPDILLHCPKDGGTYYLDSIVETMAHKLRADLVTLDAQDIALIVGPYVDENLAWTGSETSHLGYNAHRVAGKLQEYNMDEAEAGEDGGDFASQLLTRVREMRETGSNSSESLRPAQSSKIQFRRGNGEAPMVGIFGLGNDPTPQAPNAWNSLKVNTALEAIVSAADAKLVPAEPQDADALDAEADTLPRDVIIQVKDYKELSEMRPGPGLLRALRSVISKRWQEGRNIILVGTTSTDDLGLSKRDIQHLQFETADGEARTIFVPPTRKEEQDIAFDLDEKARIRKINIRHIEDMMLKLHAGNNQTSNLVLDIEKNLDRTTAYSVGLEEDVWTVDRVRRLATILLGIKTSLEIDGVLTTKALKLLAGSDEAKFLWGEEELKKEDDEANAMLREGDQPSGDVAKDKVNKIKKKCTNHEKKLLGGIKIPSEIKTTFSDVHAPVETIEALKTLTSLSLQRPEAFSYGVLATDSIPGLLLYGPPGTGKTLLAKAVARESGAIVLEVSGASVNDMYVGESEKNVKAIFSLAKKLSPCVVFIDEADALLAARGGDSRRSVSHRETINQFLREWDGMNDHSAFIMVATNRPFDLDEAVLRRLPRRLLVDLPVEKDRASILGIHLKNETLDDSVSIADLAKNTPFYSGSDLKNVSVAAALACLREENAAAAAHAGDEPYVFPAKRTLAKRHFDKALDEISASISDDMSTLKAVRSFDEKYGDRKGRRKKTSAMGFGGTTIEEKDSEAGRVRKAEA